VPSVAGRRASLPGVELVQEYRDSRSATHSGVLYPVLEWIVQAGPAAVFFFKLRRNIALEGDLALAERELRAFLPGGVAPVADLAGVVRDFPELGNLPGVRAPGADCRPAGIQGYRATAPLSLLPELAARVSFVSRIYAISREAGTVADVAPHYLLCELSDVVVRRARSAAEVPGALAALREALETGHGDLSALGAAQTTSHLFHDLHYYKAKFFPRMVRSTLNVGARALGLATPRVVDPFAGSGTTLLEASLLGMPGDGYDLDPLAVLIAGAKVDALHGRGAGGPPALPGSELSSRPEGGVAGAPIAFPAWLVKNRRFTPDVRRQLEREIHDVRRLLADAPPECLPLYRVIVSDAISRRIRMRLLGTGVGRFSLAFSKATLAQLAEKNLARVPRIAAATRWLADNLPLRLAPAMVHQGDARALPAATGPFDLLVTSPPYLPASSGRETYAKARVLSFLALGVLERDRIDDLVDSAVGSMDAGSLSGELPPEEQALVDWLAADQLRAIKAVPTARYFEDMRACFQQMRRILAPGGVAVVVSGRQSTFYQFATREPLYVAPTARLLAEAAERAGLERESLIDVPLAKANKNARPRSLDDYYETLIVLRQPAGAGAPAGPTGDPAGSLASR